MVVENRQGEFKNSVGNVETNELLCMTHRHDLKDGNVGGRGIEGEKVQRISSINGSRK